MQSGFSLVSFTGEENNFFNEGSPSIFFDNGFISIPTSVSEFQNNLPDFRIYQNYPNPFSYSTTISFDLITENTAESIELIIYNIKGQKIRQYAIFNNQSSIIWNGTDNQDIQVSNGIYFYRIQYRNNDVTEINRTLANDIKKLILLR